MKQEVTETYNPITEKYFTRVITLEQSEKKPFCKFCGKTIDPDTFCYMSVPYKDFGCTDCVQDGQVKGITTGCKISLLSHQGKNLSVWTVKVKY